MNICIKFKTIKTRNEKQWQKKKTRKIIKIRTIFNVPPHKIIKNCGSMTHIRMWPMKDSHNEKNTMLYIYSFKRSKNDVIGEVISNTKPE